jgi:hypothetical protein
MTESLQQPTTDHGALRSQRSGMLAGTRIRTLEGTLPVEYLEPGDRIVTRSGARRLVGVSVIVLADADLIRIRASTLGHDRPDQDLLVLPAQPIVIRDWRAQALFGAAVAAIPAARLVDGEFIRREAQQDVRLYALQFDEDEVVFAEGLEVACPAQLPATVSG